MSHWGFLPVSPVRGRVGKESDRQPSVLTPAVHDAHVAVPGGLADDRGMKVPFVQYLRDLACVVRRDHDEHSFLALREHDFVRRHSRLAPRNFRYVDAEARPALVGRFDRSCGQPSRAQVLQANEPPGIGQLQARLDQHLFEKRVAHLNCGAQIAVVLEAPRREAGRPVNAVTSRIGPDQHEEVAGRTRRRAEELVCRNDADAHRVYERVVGVRVGEDDLAADVGNADAVAVFRDAGNDAAK